MTCRHARIAAALAATLMLLAPALWNGFPLLQYDTGGYLARWYEGTSRKAARPSTASISSRSARPDFWPACACRRAHGVGAWLTLRAHGLATGRWCCSSPSPRCRSPPRCLAREHAAHRHLRRARRARALSRGAARRHARALGALGADRPDRVLGRDPHRDAGGAAGAARRRAIVAALVRRGLVPRRGLGAGIAALALGAVLLLAANYAVAGRLAWTPGGSAIPFGRMLQAGIVARYLAEHCPDPRLRALRASRQAADRRRRVLLGREPVRRARTVRGPGRRDAHRRARKPRRLSAAQIKAAASAAARQLVRVATGYGVHTDIWHTYGMIERFAPRRCRR